MTPVGMNSATQPYSAQASSNQTPSKADKAEAKEPDKDVQSEKNGLVLTEDGKALLAALSEIDKEAKESESSVKSFAHGALGMDHPDEAKEQEDGSYSAGQYLKGAATVGALLLAIV